MSDTTNPVAEEAAGVESVADETEVLDAVEGQEGDGEGEAQSDASQPDDDSEEVELDGQKYRVPKALKPQLLMHADYTRKTQEVAEQRKALETERATLIQQAEARSAFVEDQARVVALRQQVEAYKGVDWNSLAQQDPATAQAAFMQYQTVRDQLTDAERELGSKVQQRTLEEQRETAKRYQDGYAKLPSIVKGWSPTLEGQLATFAAENGLSQKDLHDTIVENPARIEMLRLAMVGAQAEKQQSQAKKQAQAQKTKPVETVRGAAGRFAPAADTADFAAFEKWADGKLRA